MSIKPHFSRVYILLTPAFFAFIMLMLVIKSYYGIFVSDVADEYKKIEFSLSRSAKIMTTLDYSFVHHLNSQTRFQLEHNEKIENGMCQIWPPKSSILRRDSKNTELLDFDISYMIIGDESLCDKGSQSFNDAKDKIGLAPILSYLHNLDEYFYGIHYIDKEGYVISSPDSFAKSLSKELLLTLKARPYWQRTAANEGEISFFGPADILFLEHNIVNMTSPVFYKGKHQGMLSLDINIDELLATPIKFIGQFRIIDLETTPIPNDAYLINKLSIPGVNFHHAVYYSFDLTQELIEFVKVEKATLFIILSIYVLAVMGLLYTNGNIERKELKRLASRDPMTGLLNRRGMKTYWLNETHDTYTAMAILDIDNFKQINDTYGHDVGDDAICYMADQIVLNLRNHDTVARFGGEEFVICLKDHDEAHMRQTLERVIKAIADNSPHIVNGGFTVSGGGVIVQHAGKDDFSKLFKAADEKLYHAKTNGKNKIIF